MLRKCLGSGSSTDEGIDGEKGGGGRGKTMGKSASVLGLSTIRLFQGALEGMKVLCKLSASVQMTKLERGRGI